MTVHQLHYTSCEDGLEGIQGFQISAMTPGSPKPLVDLAVRASAYEVGPGLIARLEDADRSTFPVAFGYLPSGPGATLFQSRYIGSDFTGRTGNYFAHALLLNDAERELHGVLPIDMWRSPTWVHTRQNGTTLPAVTGLTPGSATDAASTDRFLREPGRLDRLTHVITAGQRLLCGDRGRLVLVVPDDHTAALWLAALCRSLPRALGLEISFVTYTSRPEDTAVRVACTTPDVRLPSYGDFTAIDLTGSSLPEGEATRYAGILARLWRTGGAPAAIDLAERVTPPLLGTELEAFAVLLECGAGPSAATTPSAEPLLLDAARLAVDRLPGTLTADGWRRIGELLTDGGGPTDLRSWAEVLQSAAQRSEPLPAALLGAYYVAALADPLSLWLPRLTAEELDEVADNAVLPALTGSRSAAIRDRLGTQRDLVQALVRVLRRRLADDAEFWRLATTLTPPAARLVRQVAPDGPPALLADVVLARDGQGDRVAVLTKAVAHGSTDWSRLGEVLWPAEPSTADATHAVRKLQLDVLRGTGLLSRTTARLVRLIERDELGPKELALVEDLLDDRIVGELRPADRTLLGAARTIDYFRRNTPDQRLERVVEESLDLLDTLPPPIADRMLTGIAEFTLRADAPLHRDLLMLMLETGDRRFRTAYRDLARARLAKAQPNQVAPVIVIWWSLPNGRARQQLINETLPDAVARRRSKHLDAIGNLLSSTANKLAIDVPAPKGNWRTWWKSWRSVHERRGLLQLLGLRKGS
ncbi:MAG TPA: hypothetical protein VFV67_29765 [Actinophytocola sp.]|uniref:GAP1-N2 domain-containing protein n=1 Tax=Actinophytocola sp. TaxID=1872138 RepID=UPI002DB8BFFA|nr:hypothetical protein [Actinophytocola sp.]HEU5474852.1 hypothetical protein [Actinophytocola sp.]